MGLTAQQAAGFMGMVEMSGLDTSSAMMGLKTAMKCDEGRKDAGSRRWPVLRDHEGKRF